VEDIREPDNDDESIWRVDGPNDLTKDQSHPDVNEENSDQSTSYPGRGFDQDNSKTKYPYRDDRPNTHNSAQPNPWHVTLLHLLQKAPSRLFRAGGRVKVAATSEEILAGLDPDFQERAQACTVTLKRADIRNLRWIFVVNCGHKDWASKIKAVRGKGNITDFNKLDLQITCSCPAWRWLGPEFHAKGDHYIDGKPRGTASPPNIRDPERDNFVCKHVAAVLAFTRGWKVPVKVIRKPRPKKK
jgi:hypothetical protein